MARILVVTLVCAECVEKQFARSKEACCPLRERLEPIETKTRRSWIREVLGEGDFRQHVPEDPIGIAPSLDNDVRIPNVIVRVLLEAIGDEHERVRENR